MTNQELPDYCLVFHWGAIRIAILSRAALLKWGGFIAAACTGALSWHRIMELL
jgi:hypothetical protein